MSYWREKSVEVIEKAIGSLNLMQENLTEQDKQQLIKSAIDASYPFETRKNHPYKIWLDERRKAFYRLGLAELQEGRKGARRKPAIGCDSTVPGQQSLF